MKKLLLILTFAVIATGATAQRGFYHQVGDTVRGMCPIYQYQNDWWPVVGQSDHLDSLATTEPIIRTWGYMKHTTTTPVKVIGVASVLTRVHKQTGNEDVNTALEPAMYYVLLDATTNGLVEKARVCWTDDYMTHPKRYMLLPSKTGICSNPQDHIDIASLREYYFDSAITLTDSFYLGCALPTYVYYDDEQSFQRLSYETSHGWKYCSYTVGTNDLYKDCATHIPEFTYYDSLGTQGWVYTTRKCFQLIFPIIEADTACVTPEVPYVAHRDSLMLRVEWIDNNNAMWEVSRVRPGFAPERGMITHTTTPYIEYTDIDDRQTYNIFVRGYCETGVFSGWSDWSAACYIDSIPTPTPPAGIAVTKATAPALFPNPTDGSVLLVGAEGDVSTIEVMDMAGHTLKTFEQTTSFNISSLPSGNYVVRVTTTQDNTTYLKLVKR